jgi:hypothetical protein
MTDDVHPAVVLIVERMKSHPEEFAAGLEAPRHLGSEGARWGRLLERMEPWLSDADKAYLDQHFRALAMERIHHDMLDELMNGPERRAELERRTAALAAQQAQMANQVLAQKVYEAQSKSGLTAYQAQAQAQAQLGSGITGKKATSYTVDELKNDSVLDALGRYILKLGDKK